MHMFICSDNGFPAKIAIRHTFSPKLCQNFQLNSLGWCSAAPHVYDSENALCMLGECDPSICSALFPFHASRCAMAVRLHDWPPTFGKVPSWSEMLVKRIRGLQWSHCPLRSLLLHLLSLQGNDKPQRSVCSACTPASPSSELSCTPGNT